MKTIATRFLSVASALVMAFGMCSCDDPDSDADNGNGAEIPGTEVPGTEVMAVTVESLTSYSAVLELKYNGVGKDTSELKVTFAQYNGMEDRSAAVLEEEGKYKAYFTGLLAATAYQAYYSWENESGNTARQPLYSFTTHEEDALVTGPASEIKENSAMVSCTLDLSAGIYENVSYGVAYNADNLDPMGNGSSLVTSDNLGSGTSFSVELKDLSPGKTYCYRAWANIDGAVHYGELMRFETLLSVNESEEVDLGLSVLWRGTNLGASSAAEYRPYYYAWGETAWHTGSYDWMGYSDQEYNKMPMDICGNSAYDAAAAALGNGWRMPSKTELEELVDKCSVMFVDEFTDSKGVTAAGFLLSGPSGQTVFIPASGISVPVSGVTQYGAYAYLWSGQIFEDQDNVHDKAHSLVLWKGGSPSVSVSDRFCGLAIRPVKDKE